jgi:hypothetical protein
MTSNRKVIEYSATVHNGATVSRGQQLAEQHAHLNARAETCQCPCEDCVSGLCEHCPNMYCRDHRCACGRYRTNQRGQTGHTGRDVELEAAGLDPKVLEAYRNEQGITSGPKRSLKQIIDDHNRAKARAARARRLDEDIETDLKIARTKASMFTPKIKGMNS